MVAAPRRRMLRRRAKRQRRSVNALGAAGRAGPPLVAVARAGSGGAGANVTDTRREPAGGVQGTTVVLPASHLHTGGAASAGARGASWANAGGHSNVAVSRVAGGIRVMGLLQANG